MIKRFGESYIAYMNRTGMFLPYFFKKVGTRNAKLQHPLSVEKAAAIFLAFLVVIVACGFILRAYVVRHLPLEQVNRIDVLTITRDDLVTAKQILPFVLEDSVLASKLQSIQNDRDQRVLAYFIPIDYVMQGMIANTGQEWKLFERHKTIGMIAAYTFHPYAHLTGDHGPHGGMPHHAASMHASSAMKRRIIFIEVLESHRRLKSPYDDFDINVKRTPLFFVDVNLHTREILRVQETPAGSGWGSVPTPMF